MRSAGASSSFCGPKGVSIVVVTFNNPRHTAACLRSISATCAGIDWELVVVDNASSSETRNPLADLAKGNPAIRALFNEENKGFAAAVNQGIKASIGEFVVILNNDVVVAPGWLEGLLKHLENPRVGLVGPVTNSAGNEARIPVSYLNDVEREAFAAERARRFAGRCFDIPVAALFCAVLRRSLIDEIGFLDERFEVGMFEDDDFSRRVRQAGCRVVCAEDVFVHHEGGASFRRLASRRYREIFEANRRRYEEKWGEPWTPHRYRGSWLRRADFRRRDLLRGLSDWMGFPR